jgi:hypothetical protein
MSESIHEADSVEAFLKLVADFTDSWFSKEPTWGPWFRGHTDSSWQLRPKLYREPRPKRDVRILDDEFRQEFIVRAPSLSSERPQNSWDWYFLMQHSGAPTRLLDWTESALMALYFAVRNKSEQEQQNDAAVWILEPWKLNELVVKAKEVIAPGAETGLDEEDAKRYKPWLPNRYAPSMGLEKQFPAAIYPTHFQRRISSQRSCFTIHGYAFDGFDELPEELRPYLQKVVIPHSKTRDIETRLAVAGIDEMTVYPDLDGLGRWLTMVLRDEAKKSE